MKQNPVLMLFYVGQINLRCKHHPVFACMIRVYAGPRYSVKMEFFVCLWIMMPGEGITFTKKNRPKIESFP